MSAPTFLFTFGLTLAILSGASLGDPSEASDFPVEVSPPTAHNKGWGRKPFYRPGEGTIGAEGRGEFDSTIFAAPQILGEEAESLVIASDLGRYVMVLNSNGSVRCRYDAYPNWGPMGLAIVGDEIWFGIRAKVIAISAKNCKVRHEYTLPGRVGNITFVSMANEGFIIGYEVVNKGHKRDLGDVFVTGNIILWNPKKGVFWENPYEVSSPRAAIQLGTFVLISDSFWHRVFAVDVRTSKMVWSLASYYPNDMVPMGEDGFLLVEEHLNRVVSVDAVGRRRSVLFSCNLPAFRDLGMSYPEIKKSEAMTVDALENPLSLSACALEQAGRYTLYSPSSVAVAKNGYYVADTDNHRVIKLGNNGLIVREIRGLYNPVSVRILNEASQKSGGERAP